MKDMKKAKTMNDSENPQPPEKGLKTKTPPVLLIEEGFSNLIKKKYH